MPVNGSIWRPLCKPPPLTLTLLPEGAAERGWHRHQTRHQNL